MTFHKPSTASHWGAAALLGGQVWWILEVDDRIPEFLPPLYPEVWQKLLSCVFVAGVALAASTVRPTGSVKSEILSFAVQSILIGAVLTFFLFELYHFADNLISLRHARGSGYSGWADEFPQIVLAWPIISLFVFGVTAG